jgi:hypothetical protein
VGGDRRGRVARQPRLLGLFGLFGLFGLRPSRQRPAFRCRPWAAPRAPRSSTRCASELRLASDGGSRFKVFHLQTAGAWAYFEGSEIVHVDGSGVAGDRSDGEGAAARGGRALAGARTVEPARQRAPAAAAVRAPDRRVAGCAGNCRQGCFRRRSCKRASGRRMEGEAMRAAGQRHARGTRASDRWRRGMAAVADVDGGGGGTGG